MPASGLLGLVQPDLPRSPERLRVLRDSNLPLAEQISRLSERSSTIAALPDVSLRQSLFSRSLLGASGSAPNIGYTDFTGRMEIVRREQESLCRGYLPHEHLSRVLPAEQQDYDRDPIALLQNGFGSVPDPWNPGTTELALAFQARRDLVLSLLHLELSRTKRIGRKYDRQDRKKLLYALHEQEIIFPGAGRSPIQSLHDPGNAMRTAWVEHFSGDTPSGRKDRLVRRSNTLYLAKLRLPSGRVMPVAIEARRKSFFGIIGKMLVVQAGGIQNVQDRRGLRFIYGSLEDMQEGAAFIRSHLALTDVLTGDEAYRDTTIPEAPPLPFIAKQLPMISYFRMLAGHRVQLQHFTASGHLDLLYCRGRENHAIYDLYKYTARASNSVSPGLFHWMFPPEIYGINWSDPVIFEELVHHVLASLPS